MDQAGDIALVISVNMNFPTSRGGGTYFSDDCNLEGLRSAFGFGNVTSSDFDCNVSSFEDNNCAVLS